MTRSPDFENQQPFELQEKAFLIGVHIKRSHPLLSASDSLDELALLASTAGIEVVGRAYQQLEKPHPATFIGPGKIEEVREAIAQAGANLIIFDDELSPRHQRELEKAFGEQVKVIDRSALILDIFARHAQTREGALQVELAQYEYRLPRLTRQWTHLARQSGGGAARAGGSGVGLRGPGETQLEVDRREIGRRISQLEKELEAVRAHRSRYREQRHKAGIAVIALVGYTNAGKSTLLNQMAGADVYAANQLFATLDPTTRRVSLPGGRNILLSDTVGFIQKLPTTLIAAFRATLEEIAEAALILHVADASHQNLWQQVEVVEDTLAELDLPILPRILVLNKIDLLSSDDSSLQNPVGSKDYEAVVPVSAATGQGLDRLLDTIELVLSSNKERFKILIPYEHGDITAFVYENCTVLDEEHTGSGVVLEVQTTREIAARLFSIKAVSDVTTEDTLGRGI